MKFIQDSITDDLYQKCVKELNEKVDQDCWRSSSVTWDTIIKQGIVGSCIITPVSDTIHDLLEEELKSSLPEYEEVICQYYIWQSQSGISWHNDGGDRRRLFGATLYLNEVWHPDNGGWFIWENDDGYRAILPKKKFLVINDNYQYHCVTPVSLDFRCTIQIWGVCNKKYIGT